MAKLLLSLALQSLVILYVFPLINPLFRLSGSFWDALIIALFFGFLNFILRWLLVIFTLGLGYLFYILTLGVAGLIVNAVVLLMIGDIFPGKIFVPSFFSAFVGGAVLALANYVAKRETGNEDSNQNRN